MSPPVNYERLRLAGFPVELIPQRADTWNDNEERIAAELWTLIKSGVEAPWVKPTIT